MNCKPASGEMQPRKYFLKFINHISVLNSRTFKSA